ncbi:hypothetical protein [Emticicia sp. 17c]|uniref:hypothetical protein n=1 Tax=Emticicia sp. 17c TaxID=3127704 RepID=UPI00301DECB5
MFKITKWAGKHPTLVRFVILPVLFYVQCRMAFVLGAEMFFQGQSLSVSFLLIAFTIHILVALVYPYNAKELIHKFYYRLKTMQLVACVSAAAMWGFIGNQTAAYFENVRIAELELHPNVGYPFSAVAVTVTSNTVGESQSSMLTTKTYFKKYFKNVIVKIKKSVLNKPKTSDSAKALLVILGIILMAFGIVVLVCGIQCGGAAGAVALGVLGGLALLGLGIWALVGGFRRAIKMMRREAVH